MPMPRIVYVVDAWDDDVEESYVKVFSTAEKARREVARWKAARKGHNVFVGVVRRTVL